MDEYIRPVIAEDGGEIKFVKFEDGVVYIQMEGACHGCPHASDTIQYGIEAVLKRYVPEVKKVTQIAF